MDVKSGQIVYSIAGRDKDRIFIIKKVLDENYVLIADGDLRKIDDPKKKKLKHLKITDTIIEDIGQKVDGKHKVADSDVRRAIELYEDSK
jgi:large subunit ribosomal protein L14e